MPDTVIDFWRMLWETDSCVVAMLTGKPMQQRMNGYEAPSERYAEYWPLNGPLRYGNLLVELFQEYNLGYCSLHELKISHINVSLGKGDL
jgi:protein tyrosine phosphatase